MKSVLRYYTRLCTPKVQSLGFVKNKRTFARINGEILQAFTFQYGRSTPTCTVNFGIYPLCMPEPVFLEFGVYELNEFIPEKHSTGWGYDPQSEESMEKCAESIIQAIDLYLLPLFQKCHDCKSALSELYKLEELFDHNRQRALYLLHESDCAVPWQERSLFDYKKFYMALKAQNYLYVRNYLNLKINDCMKTLESPHQPNSVKESSLSRLTQYSDQLKRIDSEDFGYFEELLQANEERLLRYIAKKYPKIRLNT